LKAKRPDPATFNFCSSVSAVAATKSGFVPEDLPKDLSYAQGMGYARSKLVTEHICVRAGNETGINARVLRIGQVVGDTVHGIWNDTEAIPMMLQAATTIGAIPKLDENPLWLPVDTVAHGVVDITLSSAGTGVMNLVNHQSFHWTRDLLPALHEAGLQFEEVLQKEWIARLRKSSHDPVANPPTKLLELFASKYDNDAIRSGLNYETGKARSFSLVLASAPVLNRHIVKKFVQHWTKTSWTVETKGIAPEPTRKNKLVVLAGPDGSGKSTMAEALANRYHVPWVEGNDLHSSAALEMNKRDDELFNTERRAWISEIKDTALSRFKMEDARPEGHDVIIVTCSDLKARDRADFRIVVGDIMDVTFFLLEDELEHLSRQVEKRNGRGLELGPAESQLTEVDDLGVDDTDCIPVTVTEPREAVQHEIDALFGDVTGKQPGSWRVSVR
jgi:carbohydrate kinase (thermoresistant glucokinase family)